MGYNKINASNEEDIPIQENGEAVVNLVDYGFFCEPMYYLRGFAPEPVILARKTVAEKLIRVEQRLPAGVRLKIWDAWRHRDVQHTIYDSYLARMRKEFPDSEESELIRRTRKFVAPPDRPANPPPHSTGGAIDLTLCDALGLNLEMGTGFDHFGPEAGLYYFEKEGHDPAIRDRRRLLGETMGGEGFAAYEGEWWDYNFGTQYWAASKGEPFAFFGELKACNVIAPRMIRFANASDAPQIAKIHVESWKEAYRGLLPDAYLSSLSIPKRETAWHEILEKGTTAVLTGRRIA